MVLFEPLEAVHHLLVWAGLGDLDPVLEAPAGRLLEIGLNASGPLRSTLGLAVCLRLGRHEFGLRVSIRTLGARAATHQGLGNRRFLDTRGGLTYITPPFRGG